MQFHFIPRVSCLPASEGFFSAVRMLLRINKVYLFQNKHWEFLP